jgi:hypothetical protein
MKKNNENRKGELKKLKTENEEIKKKLTEEHGAFFGGMGGEGMNLPPEIESMFLNNIMAFENAHKSASRVQLYDFLGQPSYRKVEELTDEEVTQELDRVMKLMSSKMIILDTLCEVDDRELYRFITEELFLEETEDVQIPGMISHYTYEEFHPNHEYDIRNHSTDFIRFYLDKENDFFKSSLTSEAEKADWHLHFREAFSSFQQNEFSITKLVFDTESATIQFDIDFVGIVDGSGESLIFKGEGEMTLRLEWDYWSVNTVRFPKSSM